MTGTKQGITYFSDCKNISSITNPIIDNNVYMRLSGFLSNNWKQEDINFDTIGYGLYRDLSTKGTIWCNDASKLFTVNGTMNQGYIGITLSFPYAITNGVHELISDNKYFIFGTNVGIYDIKSPGFSLFLTKNGFEYTIMTSAGKFTMTDSSSNFAANEDIFIEFFWDKDHIYEIYDNCNVIVKVNGVAVIGGNASIHADSLVGYKFYCLDTPILSSTLKCTIKNLICYNTVPEYVDNLEYSSSSSSGEFSESSFSSKSSESLSSITNTERFWFSFASSSDGSKLVAGVIGGTIGEFNYNLFTSSDYGNNWIEHTSFSNKSWYSVASSSDGSKLAACDLNGYIYTSTDSGANWTEQTNSGERFWTGITSSSDGTKLAACGDGYIYTSIDSGVNWSQQVNSGINDWTGIASSSDGTKLSASAFNGYIYTSSDSGVNWTQQTNSGMRYFTSIASSFDGIYLATCVQNGYIYTSSNSGANWTQRTFSGSASWRSICSSSDGSKLAATTYDGFNGKIYTSSDYGANWTLRTSAGYRQWGKIACSYDGTRLVSGELHGYIYTSSDSGANWIERAF